MQLQGLTATQVQAALDELVVNLGSIDSAISALAGRLDILEGVEETEGSVLKSIKDNAEGATFTPTVASGIESMTIEEAVNELGVGKANNADPYQYLKLLPLQTKCYFNGSYARNFIRTESGIDYVTQLSDVKGTSNATQTVEASQPTVSNGIITFDGVDDYLQIPHSVEFVGTKLTVLMWIKLKTFVQGYGYISKYNSSAAKRSWSLLTNVDSKLRCYFSDTGGPPYVADSTFPVIVDEWGLFGFTFNNGEAKLYKNLLSETFATGLPSLASFDTVPVTIGRSAEVAYSNFETGDLLIAPHVFTLAQISPKKEYPHSKLVATDYLTHYPSC